MACNGDGLSRQMASKKAMIRFYVSALGSFITAMRESTGGKKKKKSLGQQHVKSPVAPNHHFSLLAGGRRFSQNLNPKAQRFLGASQHDHL